MKKILWFLLIPLPSMAQPPLRTPVPFAGYEFLNRSPVYSHSDTVEVGSYLFPKQTDFASIKLKNGRSYTNIKAIINLLTNELLFQDSLGQLYTSVVPIDAVEFNQSDINPSKAIFRTGFPKIDNFDQSTFFEVLSEGNISLLKGYKITYTDKTVLGTSAPIRQYETKEKLYAYDKENGMRRVTKSKEEVLKILGKKDKELLAFLNNHKINFKSQSELVELFNYYNSL